MKLRDVGLLGGFVAGGAIGTLLYGALWEANRLTLERRQLALPGWPESLAGTTLAVLADLHVGGEYSSRLAKQAVAMALEAEPDFIVLPGDLISYWKPDALAWVGEALASLRHRSGSVIATFGNHEYKHGNPDALVPLLEALGIRVLRNQAIELGGIVWAGIDSANAFRAEPEATMAGAVKLAKKKHAPILTLWHEPDLVPRLPQGSSLMVSGHSHGGQFTFPGGYTPMHSFNGSRFVKGFFPDAPTPLYVSRGIGTTGFPSRLGCSPEVSLLELFPAAK